MMARLRSVGITGMANLAACILIAWLVLFYQGCASSNPKVKNAEGVAVGCASVLAIQLGQQLKPAFLTALAGVVSGDGLKVDTVKLKAIAKPLLTPSLRCAFDAAVAYFLAPVPETPGVATSALSSSRPSALGAAWVQARQELGWGADGVDVQ